MIIKNSTSTNNIYQLLESDNEDDWELGLLLAESQGIDLSSFFNSLRIIYNLEVSYYKLPPNNINLLKLYNSKSNHIQTRSDSLPKEITICKKLKYLSLCRSRIIHLPDSLSSLNLLEFNLRAGFLENFPEVLTKINSLKAVDLRHNNINSLPDELSGMKNLKVLILFGNPIPYYIINKFRKLMPNCLIKI